MSLWLDILRRTCRFPRLEKACWLWCLPVFAADWTFALCNIQSVAYVHIHLYLFMFTLMNTFQVSFAPFQHHQINFHHRQTGFYKHGTNMDDNSEQWLVMSQITEPDLLRLFGNKRLKVTDKQCGQSVCQCVIKACVPICLCGSTPPSVSATFSGALCTQKAVVRQKPLNSRILWRARTMFLLMGQWQTVQQMGQRQI